MKFEDIPKKYRGLYVKGRNGSRKAAIRVKCLECCGFEEKEVRGCTDPGCPLYAYRLHGGGGKKIRNTLVPAKEYQKWRMNILERDEHTCRLCKRKYEIKDLNVHHIVRVCDNIDLIIDESNGMALCKSCHHRLHKGTLKLDNSDWDNQ